MKTQYSRRDNIAMISSLLILDLETISMLTLTVENFPLLDNILLKPFRK